MKRISNGTIMDMVSSLPDRMSRLRIVERAAQAQLASCEKELREILGKMNMRDVGGTEPEWALSNKDYQALKHKHLGREV